MKLTTVFLLVAVISVSAKSFGQKVTLEVRHASLKSVLTLLNQQTHYDYVADEQILREAKDLTLKLDNVQLEVALQKIFEDQPLTFQLDNRMIIIRQKEPSLLDRIKSAFSAADISGSVVDEKGQPMPGVTVSLKDGGQAVVTDRRGEFTLKNVAPNARLILSFIGYQQQEVPASGDLRGIRMEPSNSKLDEVQVIGYGTTTQRLSTGSMTSIKSADIQNEPLTNPIQALEGMVPGLYIQQGNGMPGAKSKVSLRGTNSFTSGNTPFYVIDGVPYEGREIDFTAGGSSIGGQPNGGSDPLNAINPDDIESIDVLKDADATAIYGSRGANGVILITTKHAKGGKTRVEGNIRSGASRVTHLVPILSTADYLALRRQAFANDGITPTAANAPDLVTWSQTADVNYEKMILGNTANTNDANLSVTAGDANNGFLLSGAYHQENSVVPGDFGYQRGTIHMKANHTSENGKFKAEFSANYGDENNRLPATDITPNAISYPDNYPLYNANGTYYFGGGFSTNPMSLLQQYYKTQTNNLILNASVSYNILSNLQLKVSGGDNRISVDQQQIGPVSAYNPALVTGASGSGLYTSNVNTTYIVEPQINYNTTISKGKLTVLVGGSYQYSDYEEPYFISAANFASDGLIENFGSAGTISLTKDYSYLYKYASAFGRVNYNWDSKYIINASYRRDGSSKFGPGMQYGNFGSVGAAWVFTEESFFKDLHWLSFGKLRGSYGTVGNDQISTYGYLDSYGGTAAPYGAVAGTVPSRVANPDLRWETTKKLGGGIALGFLDNNLLVNVDWYRDRSDNLLAGAPLTPQTGFTGYTANLPAVVQNQGWEFEVKGTPVNHKGFKWDVGFNFTAAQNKLVSYPNLAGSSYANTYVIGQPLSIVPAYNFTGMVNGVAQVQDVNGDGRISSGLAANSKGDYVVAGSLDPKFYGGFTNNFKYQNFQLDFFFNFVKQLGYNLTSFPGQLKNQYADVLDVGFKPSQSAASASYQSYINYYLSSNARLQDASFIRLRNITLSYNLPQSWQKAVKASNIRVYLSGQNLLTFTHYKGFDPETAVIPAAAPIPSLFQPTPVFPPLKTIVAGVQFSF